jgi:beta-lactamase superfamily II metal-dependent hydrolase
MENLDYKIEIKLKVFSVGCGDCITLRIDDSQKIYNIFIDSGYAKSYHTTISQELKIIERIDLWVITHIDDDHIEGTKSFINEYRNKKDDLTKKIKNVWFNLLPKKAVESKIQNFDSLKSFLNAWNFRDFLLENNIPTNDKIISNYKLQLGKSELEVISPDVDTYDKFLQKWEKEEIKSEKKLIIDKPKSKGEYDYEKPIEAFKNESFEIDPSLSNRSSIAFIFRIKEFSILFLADSHANLIEKELRKIGFSERKKLSVDYVKVSHHGSKWNLNDGLLNIINCQNYIISADGLGNKLPNKLTLSKILLANTYHKIYFYFTHDNLKLRSIFSKNDFENYSFEIIYPHPDDNFILIEKQLLSHD